MLSIGKDPESIQDLSTTEIRCRLLQHAWNEKLERLTTKALMMEPKHDNPQEQPTRVKRA
jgi:hypothetical protein